MSRVLGYCCRDNLISIQPKPHIGPAVWIGGRMVVGVVPDRLYPIPALQWLVAFSQEATDVVEVVCWIESSLSDHWCVSSWNLEWHITFSPCPNREFGCANGVCPKPRTDVLPEVNTNSGVQEAHEREIYGLPRTMDLERANILAAANLEGKRNRTCDVVGNWAPHIDSPICHHRSHSSSNQRKAPRVRQCRALPI